MINSIFWLIWLRPHIILRVNPFEYLRDVLSRFAQTPISKLAELLRDKWQPNGLTT